MSKRSIKIQTLEEKLNANLKVKLNDSENHQDPVEEIIPDYVNEDGPCTEGDPQDVPCENVENNIDYWSMAVKLFNDKIIPLFETSTHYHYMVKNNMSMDESIDRFYQIISAVFKKYNVTNINNIPNDVITVIKMEVKEFNNKHKLFFQETLTQELNKLFPYEIQFNVKENILSNISDKKVYNLIKETLLNIKNNISSNNLIEEYNIIINNIFPNETFTDVEKSIMYRKINDYVKNASIYYLEPDVISAQLKGLYIETPKEINDNELKELLKNVHNKKGELKNIKHKLTQLNEAVNSLPKEYENVDHPTHYNNYDVEAIDMMEKIWGPEETAVFCKLNAFKYRMRMGTKPDNSIQQDLKKEQWYIKKYHELKNKIN